MRTRACRCVEFCADERTNEGAKTNERGSDGRRVNGKKEAETLRLFAVILLSPYIVFRFIESLADYGFLRIYLSEIAEKVQRVRITRVQRYIKYPK